MDDRGDHWPRRYDEDDRERFGERGEDRHYEHSAEHCVHDDEAPRVGVEVAQREHIAFRGLIP